MARFRYKHIQSTVEDRVPSSLLEGEIAVNRFAGKEKLFIKNASGDVVSFSSDSAIDGKLAEKLNVSDFNAYSGAVDTTINSKASENDLETLSGTVTAHTASTNIHLTSAEKTNLDSLTGAVGTMAYENATNYYTKSETSGKTEISNALSTKVNSATYTAHTADTSAHFSGNEKENLDSLATNIAAISGITAEKVTSWDNASSDSHTHSNKSALDSITGSVGTMAYQNTSSYSSATQVNTALSGKSDTGHTHDDRYYTESELTGSSTSVVVAKAASATTAASAAVANSVALSNVTGADDLKAIEVLDGTSGLLKKTAANTWSLDTNSYSTTAVAVTGATYNEANKTIDLKNAAGAVVSTVDATAFIKDGMIESVTLQTKSGTTYLVISWNTDAGIETTELNIGDLFETDNYYTKNELTDSSTSVVVAKASSASTAANADSVALSNVTGADDLRAIEALDGTSGILKKTAANTWSLDTTSYSSATEVNTALGDKLDKSDFNTYSGAVDTAINSKASQSDLNTLSGTVTGHTANTSIHLTSTEKTNIDSLATNIAAISGITSTKVTNWDAAYGKVSGITASTAAINSLTGAVGTMAYENKNSYSSATEVNSALAGKAATATTLAGYGITDAYTKEQTSGASEIATALSYKASQSDLNAISATVTSHTASINDLSGQSETISAAINDLDNKKADSVEVFSSIATKASKPDVDDLIKQSETISAALNYLNDEKLDYVDFFDYTSQMKSALESIEDEIEDLSRTVVMSITTTDARGYGESTPTLASYTGNKSNLNGILSHFKLGWFNSGGTLVQECAPGRISAARDGSEIAINGSNGDLMVYVDTDIYRDRATVSGLTVNGSTATTHNVIGLGLAPHQIGGSVAKKFSPFGFTPHCAKYSNGKGYSYYDGGNVQTSINSLASSVNALNKGGGYMGLYYEFYEIWLIAMYLELGTLDFTQDTLFGYGCTNYTPTASNWFSDVNAGGGGCMYTGNTYGSFWTNTVSSYNFAEMLEAQRIMDGVVKADLVDSMGGTVMMTYDSNGNVVLAPEADPSSWANSTGMTENKKYFTVKNVPGCQGLGDGVMTGVVNIYVKGTDRIRKYSHPIYRGVDLLSGFFVQLEGLHYVVKHTGTTASLAQSQELFYCESWLDVPTDTSVYTNANSIVTADTAEGLTDDPVLVATYRNAGAFPTGSDGWGRETDYNISLFAHRTIGGAQHTYECGHIWYRGTSWSSPAGTDSNGWLKSNAKSANASVVGCNANVAYAGRTLAACNSVANSIDHYAGGFAHPQIKVK